MKKYILFILLIAAISCIDPFLPDLSKYKSLLVVEGQMTDENKSYEIRLSRTIEEADGKVIKVEDASVSIRDADGTNSELINYGDGIYRTDSTRFRGIAGHKYVLIITTSDEKEYRSDECLLLPAAGIDSLYIGKGSEYFGTTGESQEGLKIFLNTGEYNGISEYYRWTFEEVWKVDVPFPQQYKYTLVDYNTINFTPLQVFRNECYKRNLSSSILTNSVYSGGNKTIQNQEIHFIAPLKTDRLTKEYSILVKQYSISKGEYEFWNNLKKVGEPDADIFASQPYSVISNIHNVNDRSEMVLGYFGASGVTQKLLVIKTRQLDEMDLPHYVTDCVEIRKSPEDWPVPPPPTWDEIYHGYTDLHDFIFVRPEVTEGTIISGDVETSQLVKLVFASRQCAICDDQVF